MIDGICSTIVRALMRSAVVIAGCLCLIVPCLAQDQVPAGDILISAFEDQDYQAAVAFNDNPAAKEFLVVWSHTGTIYGQRYTWQGVPQKGNFVISDGSSGAYRPAVTYSLHADSYLVVWEDSRNGDYDIYGQLVDADGSRLDDNFGVYTGAGNQQQPNLAFDGNRYLVVWQSDPDGNLTADILGRFVDDSGTIDDDILSIGGAGDTVYRQQPAVAYNATADEYLIVYQYSFGDQAQIIARRVDPGEFVFPAEYTVVAQPDAGCPGVAAAAWGAYVVVWDDSRWGESDIYGRVALAGSNSFDGEDFPISTAYADQVVPRIARSPSTRQFLVAWYDGRLGTTSGKDIYAQRLQEDANLIGTNFAVSSAPEDQVGVALAASQEPDIYLVLWEDRRRGLQEGDIYGQRVAWTGSLLWYDFAVSAQPDQQTMPDVAYNATTGEYMVVWEDNPSGYIHTQRISAEGQPLEGPQHIQCGGLNHHPAVATDGSFWIVAWRDLYQNAIQHSPLYAQGGPVTCLTTPDTAAAAEMRLAYATPTGPFLMVWQQGGDIYGGILGTGPLLEGPFVISSGGPMKAHPSVAFDEEHRRFLVVWQETVEPNPDIFGRLITPEGEFATVKFLIAGGTDASTSRWHPSVAYNPDDNEYLVVYGWGDTIENDIYGRRVTWDGDPEEPGGEFVVWSGGTGVDQAHPEVVYVTSAHRYYILWADARNMTESGYDLYGRWLEANGNPVGPALPFFRYPGSQEFHRLAYDPDHEQILAVWADDRRYTSDVYARLGALDVTPPVARFFHVPLQGQPGTTFLFSAQPSTDNLTPPGALAVRWDWTSNGSWDTEWSLDKVVTQTAWIPGTYNVTLQVRDLVSYTDTLSHPVQVLAAGGKGPRAALTADANSATAGDTVDLDASASTDDETPDDLQARWDWESDGEWDTDFSSTLSATHAFTMAGEQTVRAEVQDAGGLTDAAFYNVTVLPGSPITLKISPAAVTMGPHDEAWFRATARDIYGNRLYHPAVAWSVTHGDAGIINSSGLFSAGLQAGTYADVILAESNGVTDTARVTIVYPYQVYLPIVLR